MSSFVFYWHSDGNIHSEKVIEDDKVLVLIDGWYHIAAKISEYVIVPYKNDDVNSTK
jgi:hypothetical protein